MIRFAILTGVLLLSVGFAGARQSDGEITVEVDHPTHKISPTFYGLMTEEINHAYDGGLYAELIQNRIFADNATQPSHWSSVERGGGKSLLTVVHEAIPGTRLSTSLRLSLDVPVGGRAGVSNDGYWGIPVEPNTTYTGSFYAKSASPLPLQVSLEGFSTPGQPTEIAVEAEHAKANAAVVVQGGGWRKYNFKLKTGAVVRVNLARLVLTSNKSGTLALTLVSLFGPTYHNRSNGNRPDLMKKLAELAPSFLRLPGGNYLEGNTIPERFEWKDTIGPLTDRPGHQGPWGYRSSDGLGLLEFLEWCEDLRMQPVLAVYAGYSLRGAHVNPGPDLEPFVQDALDEIEYVTGGQETKWGAKRIADGHPKPFPLTYVEVGNEDSFDRSGSYDGRFTQFYDAIKAKYPALQIIATTPVKTRTPDVLDDHYYRTALAMERDAGHYDSYPRTGPKIFVGEWASTQGSPTPNYLAALGDAAWLTGLERNSDLVVMESYAPLLVNVNRGAAQWPTNLIGYDALNSFGSPSFYVQSLFGQNAGDVVLPVNLDIKPQAPIAMPAPRGRIGVGTWLTDAEYKDIEVTVDGKSVFQSDFSTGIAPWRTGRGTWVIDDGSLRQSDPDVQDSIATVGQPDWGDYTVHLKARKLGGREGFFVLFHVQDRQNYMQWNIGGWGNERTSLQVHEGGDSPEVGTSIPMHIETGKWYDVRIELKNGMIRCYLDDKLVTTFKESDAHSTAKPLYATASRDTKTGDIILKVVNVSGTPLSTTVNLQGTPELDSIGTAWQLTGKPEDVNTLAEPRKVAPVKTLIAGVSQHLGFRFPAYSVTVIRLKPKR